MKYVLILALFLSSILLSQSTNLFIPLEVQRAFENGTHSYDGTVGENYWINHTDYKIDVELFPDSNLIVGSEKIIYYNESPDSLTELIIRLYQNITKPGSVRNWNYPESALNNGMIINELKLQNKLIDLNSGSINISGTNMSVRIKNKLGPGSPIELEINWEFEIPQEQIRMGNYNGNYFIAYWYPQISVYDDVYGWDELQYAGTVEFYNDFNNYEINITVPDNYVIWTTGYLQNAEDVFQKSIIEKIQTAKDSDETVNIITPEDYHNNRVTIKNDNNKNRWRIKANKVPDVAWAASNNYNWDASSIEVEDGRRVMTAAIYPDSIKQYKDAAFYAHETIKYLSEESPGYPYPWSHTTSFCNSERGGGMEFPMMQNNGAPKRIGSNVGLIFHEIVHSYFPFYMGINERRAAWMEEGWASFFPGDFVKNFDSLYDYHAYRVASYLGVAGTSIDMPMILPSYMMTNGEMRNNFYNRPVTAYEELRHLLGNELFHKALIEFMDRWHEKHPIAYDFFFTFDDVVGEDLSWFWNPWFFELGYPDLGIENVDLIDRDILLTIKKVGNIPTRIAYTFIFEDGTSQHFLESANNWKDSNIAVFKHSTDKKLVKVKLGDDLIPDINQKNDVFEM